MRYTPFGHCIFLQFSSSINLQDFHFFFSISWQNIEMFSRISKVIQIFANIKITFTFNTVLFWERERERLYHSWLNVHRIDDDFASKITDQISCFPFIQLLSSDCSNIDTCMIISYDTQFTIKVHVFLILYVFFICTCCNYDILYIIKNCNTQKLPNLSKL